MKLGAREDAENHCQIGNLGLALKFVVTWLDFQLGAEEEGLLRATSSSPPASRPS